MKNKYTRKSAAGLFFDFTVKENKAKRITRNVLTIIGIVLSAVGILLWFWVLYMAAYACM